MYEVNPYEWNNETFDIDVSKPGISFGGGAEYEFGKNKIVFNLDRAKMTGIKEITSAKRTRGNLSIKRYQDITKHLKATADIGFSQEFVRTRYVYKPETLESPARESFTSFRRAGAGVGVGLEYNFTKNLALETRIGYSGSGYMGALEIIYGNTGLSKRELSASIGLHYKMPNPGEIKLPDLSADKKPKKQKRRKVNDIQIPCYNYKPNKSKTNNIFNKP
jgi:opacity protein-like surface antigen